MSTADNLLDKLNPHAYALDALDAEDSDWDPLAAVDYTAGPEKAAKQEMSELLKAFDDRRRREAERFRLATDSEYWFAVCFQTREQKEAFLAALDLLAQGDKYLDGAALAKRLGVALPAAAVPYNVSARIDPKLAELTGPADSVAGPVRA